MPKTAPALALAPTVSGKPDIKKLPKITMPIYSFNRFNDLPTFPRQRNHEVRAKLKSVIERLSTLLPTHFVVQAICLPDGRLFKIDGHTRFERWASLPECDRPNEVYVLTYHVEDLEEAKRIYDAIDNRGAQKTSQDALYSAMRENNIFFFSPLLREGGFGESLNVAWKRSNVHCTKSKQLLMFKSELKSIDSLLPGVKKPFVSPVLAAALLTIKRDGALALEFWKEVNTGGVSKVAQQLFAYIKDAAEWGTFTMNARLAGVCCAFYDQWCANPHSDIDGVKFANSTDGVEKLAHFKTTIPGLLA